MKSIIVTHGGYAHGTLKEHGAITIESMNNENNIKEYAIRPTINSDCWKTLIKYEVEEKEI